MKNAYGNALNNHKCSENWVRNNSESGAIAWQSSASYEKKKDASEDQNGSHARSNQAPRSIRPRIKIATTTAKTAISIVINRASRSNENELSDRWRERAWIEMEVFS